MNDGIPARSLKPATELFANKEHGTRGRYLSGCKCFYCRRANSDYERERKAARERGDWNGYVTARRARTHMKNLSACGIGRRAIVEKSGVGKTTICEIRSGKKKQIRALTERKILSVQPILLNAADNAIIDAAKTWERIRQIKLHGYNNSQIAFMLGYRTPRLQIRKDNCTGKNARLVRDLWIRICYKKRD